MKRILTALALALLLALPALAAAPGQSQQLLRATEEDGYTLAAVSLGSYTADAMRQAAGTDLAFLPSGLLSLNLQPGTVDSEALALSFPQDEAVYAVTLSAGQLAQLLELSASHLTVDMQTERLDKPASQWGGFLQLSGLRVTFNGSAPAGGRIWAVQGEDGVALDLETSTAQYTAAVPASMLDDTYGYAEFLSAPGDPVGTLRQLVGDRVAAEGISQEPAGGRILLYGVRANEIIDYFPPLLILLVVVLMALFGGHGWRRKSNFER